MMTKIKILFVAMMLLLAGCGQSGKEFVNSLENKAIENMLIDYTKAFEEHVDIAKETGVCSIGDVRIFDFEDYFLGKAKLLSQSDYEVCVDFFELSYINSKTMMELPIQYTRRYDSTIEIVDEYILEQYVLVMDEKIDELNKKYFK